ncbi:hypothetical protein D3C85_1585660 [compost metagenome]
MQALPFTAVHRSRMVVFTSPPSDTKAAATAAVIKPPATAYSTMVRPSSSFTNFITEALIDWKVISPTSLRLSTVSGDALCPA